MLPIRHTSTDEACKTELSKSNHNSINFSLKSRKVRVLMKCGNETQIEKFFYHKKINNIYDKNKVIAQIFSGLQIYLGDCV